MLKYNSCIVLCLCIVVAVHSYPLPFPLAHLNFPERILPSQSFTGEAIVWNTQTTAWSNITVTISADGFGRVIGPTNIEANQAVLFSTSFHGHDQIGRYFYRLSVEVSGEEIVNLDIPLEVTCSDGIFCNGIERFVQGACVPAATYTCDDGYDCTVDHCDEETQLCSHYPTGTDCLECKPAEACEPDCDGKECGPDGCGSYCGQCGEGLACSATFQCAPSDHPGSCQQPFDLFDGGNFHLGTVQVYFNTEEYTHQVNEHILLVLILLVCTLMHRLERRTGNCVHIYHP